MRRAVIDERAIDFVADDGDAARPREFQHRCCSSRDMIQPVGLPGEAMKIALVRASHAQTIFEIELPARRDAFHSSSSRA